MEERSSYVLWFQECDLSSIPLAGGKNASLGELLKANIPVPPGFALTTKVYDRFLDEGGIKEDIFRILEDVREEDVSTVESASQGIRQLIEKTSISPELEDYIGEFYRQLSVECHIPAVPAAIRSSATAEDLPGASFAGQQETFLWIRGVDEVLTHVRKCWSSLFTPRAITYRVKMGFPHEKVSISVGVQKMVNSWTAGVMFTISPATGDLSTISIDANWGFGESVVSGECTPDHFLVNKITMEIVRKNISPKECIYTLNPETHSVERHDIPPERSENQCIVDEDVIELAKVGKLIEKHYGKAMDIEWAIDKDMPDTRRVMIVQSRPETVWSQKKAGPQVKPKVSTLQYITGSLKPDMKDQ